MSAEPDNIAAVESDPTDAELDEIEQEIADPDGAELWGSSQPTILRLIKALRAYRQQAEKLNKVYVAACRGRGNFRKALRICRAQSKAKDAVVEAVIDCANPAHPVNQAATFVGYSARTAHTRIPTNLWNRVLKSLKPFAALDKEVGDAE